MKTIFAFLTSVLVFMGPLGSVQAASSYSEDGLRALNFEHVRIVRQASRVCAASSQWGFARYNHRNPCVIGDVERHIRFLEKPELLAFHQTLPLRRRFDAQRSIHDVRPFFN